MPILSPTRPDFALGLRGGSICGNREGFEVEETGLVFISVEQGQA